MEATILADTASAFFTGTLLFHSMLMGIVWHNFILFKIGLVIYCPFKSPSKNISYWYLNENLINYFTIVCTIWSVLDVIINKVRIRAMRYGLWRRFYWLSVIQLFVGLNPIFFMFNFYCWRVLKLI